MPLHVARAEDSNEYQRQWNYIKRNPECVSVPEKVPKRCASS